MEDEGSLTFFGYRFAVLFVEVDGGDDDVGEIAIDFGARGCAVLHDAVGDACGGCVFLVVSGPGLRGVGAGPSMGRELVDDGDVAFFVGSVGSVGSTDDVQPGRNGWVYPTGNITALSDALTAAIQMSPAERERASALSSTLGQAHAAPFVASGFIDGALEAIARKTKP